MSWSYREPKIVGSGKRKGRLTLSVRRLGAMLSLVDADAVSLDALQVMIRNKDVWVRYNAAKLLGNRGDRAARLVIEDALATGNVLTRASVARHLYGLSWHSAEPLLRQAIQDKDVRVRESVIYSLCGMGNLNAYQMLVDTLNNAEDIILEAAAYGLRDTYDSAAVPVLQQVLKANDPEVRIKGLDALGICGAPEGIPVAREALYDPDPDVVYAAVLTLFELAREAALGEVAGLILETTGFTREQVIRAFFHATNYLKIDIADANDCELVLTALEQALHDERSGVRRAAIWSVAWMRHNKSAEITRRAYDAEADSGVKANIVRVAVSLMALGSETLLEDASQSEDEVVRQAAQAIHNERERTGITLTYDEDAYQGISLNRTMRLGKFDER